MTFHLLVCSGCYIVGALAIPSDASGQFGNIGTTATCTAQGFLIYISGRVAVLYYSSFSVYSYVAVLNDFNKTNYQWCEKWIHILVHIHPVGMAFYFLSVESFNPGFGFCKVSSLPNGCDVSDEIPCERGPDTYDRKDMMFYLGIPVFCMMLLPTLVMAALYFKVKERERGPQQQTQTQPVCVIRSKTVVLQSCVYLSSLYWTLLPFCIIMSLRVKDRSEIFVPFFMFAQINFALFGLWSMLIYRHFSVDSTPRSTDKQCDDNGNGNGINRNSKNSMITASAKQKTSTQRTDITEYIFSAEEQQPEMIENNGTPLSTITTTVAVVTEATERQYSFNIFDGTNAKGAFADFIHDGDSEDGQEDNEQSAHWNAVQDHI